MSQFDPRAGEDQAQTATHRSRVNLRAPFRILLALASLATAAVGLWLLWVMVTVLPTRDPGHIPMWRTVAACFFAYSGLCWGCVATDAKAALLRGSVLIASVAAVGLGLYGITSMLRRADAGGHFEGYIVLMGLILAGHGVTGVIYTMLAGRAGPVSVLDRQTSA